MLPLLTRPESACFAAKDRLLPTLPALPECRPEVQRLSLSLPVAAAIQTSRNSAAIGVHEKCRRRISGLYTKLSAVAQGCVTPEEALAGRISAENWRNNAGTFDATASSHWYFRWVQVFLLSSTLSNVAHFDGA